MQRFYEYFVADGAMPELSEAEAHARGIYVTEVTFPNVPRHLQAYVDNELDHVVYPDASPSDAIAATQRARYPQVRHSIVSPTTREGEISRRTIWDYTPEGTLERRSEYTFEPRRTLDRWFHPDGRFGGMLERIYDEHGEEIEVREHSPDGRVLVHD